MLAGDDLSGQALADWYEQEKEAYFEEDAALAGHDPWYAYMRYVNDRLAFRTLAGRPAGRILFLGAGDGAEAVAVHERHASWQLVFVESSDSFRQILRARYPEALIKEPDPTGRLPLDEASVDVVCAFSVLHHIANVSAVVGEVQRVLSPGGIFFVREPCASMGDWRGARSATPNERGISREAMIAIAQRSGLTLDGKAVPVVLSPINKLLTRTVGYRFIPFPLLYAIDRAMSSLLAVNDHYWRDTWYRKIGPSSYHYTFKKPVS